MDWSRNKYNEYYNYYMPWVEDKYLQWFGENKTSYSTKETLKTDFTGNDSVNAVQGGVAEGVGGQFAKGGALQPIGEAVSKEGFNRAERGMPEADKQQKSWAGSAKDGASSAGSAVGGAASSAGSAVGGMFGAGGSDGGEGEKKEGKREEGKRS